MPKLTIDGKEVEVAGGHQPHRGRPAGRRRGAALLLSPRRSASRASAGSAWWTSRRTPRPQIACNTPGGRRAWSSTRRPSGCIETRQSIMEFHLINHPLDCPVCDQAGECWLQIYYMQHGLYDPRMADEKVHKPKAVPLGPHVILDAERCILCSRCVRFCDEVTGTGELGIFNRGRPLGDRPLPGQDAREQVLGQRHRHLPGGRAHRPRLPLPGARLVPRHRQVASATAARAAATSRSTRTGAGRTTTRAAASRGSSRASTPTSTSGGSATRAATASAGSTTRAGSCSRSAAAGAQATAARLGRGARRRSSAALRRYRPEEIGDPRLAPDVERGPLRAAAARRASSASGASTIGVPPRVAGRRGRLPDPRRQESQQARAPS